MSTLVIEVCEVAAVEKHPYADRLGIATVKGWKTVIGYDPITGEFEFAPGERCIYFPPDSILPPALANSPYKVCRTKGCKAMNKAPSQLAPAQQPVDDRCALCGNEIVWKDGTPGRTGAMAFCAELPRNPDGTRPPGGRVLAARLRGLQSFGFIMKIDLSKGDDPNWPVGTDLREHFHVSKWEPPIESVDGEVETPHPAFHTYTDIEHLANYPGVLPDGEEVVFTEKLHGKNCRLGYVLVTSADETAEWTWMAGSHNLRRKAMFPSVRRFKIALLMDQHVLPNAGVVVGQIIPYDGGKFWRVSEVEGSAGPGDFWTEEVHRLGDGSFTLRTRVSEFWEPLTDNVKAMLTHVRDHFEWPEPKKGIVLFGESIGTQDMKYGLTNERGFRAFDLAINGRYLDLNVKQRLFEQFGIESVPVVYRGPFESSLVEKFTDGPTTLCEADAAGSFGGREGIVIAPVVERIDDRMMPTSTHGRVIFKSVSADYLARKGGTDAH